MPAVYSTMNFIQFAKRAKITFGAAAKGNLLSVAMCLYKVNRLPVITLRMLFLGGLTYFEPQYKQTKVSNTVLVIQCNSLLVQN